MGLEQTLNTHDSLVKKAKRIDFMDAFTGPLSSSMYYSGSEYLQSFATVLKLTELVVVKVPFVVEYLIKTKDYASLLHWAPKEILANLIPAGGFLDVIPTYYMRVEYMNKK